MATRNGLLQIKDLIKNGELSENHPYSHGFLFHCHGDIHAGRYTLEIDGRFVYFYAKRFFFLSFLAALLGLIEIQLYFI